MPRNGDPDRIEAPDRIVSSVRAIVSERSGDPDRIEDPDRIVRSVRAVVQLCNFSKGPVLKPHNRKTTKQKNIFVLVPDKIYIDTKLFEYVCPWFTCVFPDLKVLY